MRKLVARRLCDLSQVMSMYTRVHGLQSGASQTESRTRVLRYVAELGTKGGRGLVGVDVGAVGGLAGGGDGVVAGAGCAGENGGGVGRYLGEGGEGDDGVCFLEGSGSVVCGCWCWRLGLWLGLGSILGLWYWFVDFDHFVIRVEVFFCRTCSGRRRAW